MSTPHSTISLRALEGTPLTDEKVRRIVEATARAIAERHNVELVSMETRPDRVTVTLAAHRLAAIGFIAELRRLTTAWYHTDHPGEYLWGDAHGHNQDDGEDDDPADWWKHV